MRHPFRRGSPRAGVRVPELRLLIDERDERPTRAQVRQQPSIHTLEQERLGQPQGQKPRGRQRRLVPRFGRGDQTSTPADQSGEAFSLLSTEPSVSLSLRLLR